MPLRQFRLGEVLIGCLFGIDIKLKFSSEVINKTLSRINDLEL